MLDSVFEITLGMSAVILIILLLMPVLGKRYSARWRYFVWLVISLRLAVPINITLPDAPVTIPSASRSIPMPGALPRTNEISPQTQPADNTSDEPAKPIISLYDFLTYVWAAGAVLFFAAQILSYFRFKVKIKPYCSPFENPVFEHCCKQLNIKRRPKAVLCVAADGPMMTGFTSPIIILPENEYSEKELELILTHELTHLKRGDIWYKLLLAAACSIHWFNPIVHIMARFAVRDLEYACDDDVVKNSGLQYRKEYSMTILKSMQHGKKLSLSAYLGREVQRSKKNDLSIF